jgi:hypothetical protein
MSLETVRADWIFLDGERVEDVADRLRAAPRIPAVIDYTIGNEHSPTDPFGRIVLHIGLDGAATLELHSRTGGGQWAGQVGNAQIERIMAALDRANFPSVPHHLAPADSALRSLTVTMAGDEEHVVMTEKLGKELEGYKEAFAILDSLAVQVSSGAYKGAKDTVEPSVSNVRAL